MTRAIQWLSLALFAAVLVACGERGGSAGEKGGIMATIEGEVYYRERIALPPGAEVEVQLQDISRADAPAAVMVSVMFQPDTAPPWPFSIEYDTATIDPRMRYALRATVSVQGRLMFTTTEYIDPFAGNPLRVLVRRVAEPVAAAPASEPEPPPAAATWLLDTLHGERAPLGADGNPLNLVLDTAEGTVAGYSGCNSYTGNFSSEGEAAQGTPFVLGPLATTMRACVDGGEIEQDFLRTLGGADAYRLGDGKLELLAGDEVVATFRMP